MFFKKKTDKVTSYLVKIGALLIHAAKIDENFTVKEEEIIKKTLLELGGPNIDLNSKIIKAKENEEQSNQILDFTQEIKKMSDNEKIKIVETLWKIIYSNNDADIYETNLMRRLTGLLYIDNRLIGDIREKIKKEIS